MSEREPKPAHSTTTDLERWLPVQAIRYAIDPEHAGMMAEHQERMARIEAGETTYEQEYGPAMTAADIQARIDAL